MTDEGQRAQHEQRAPDRERRQRAQRRDRLTPRRDPIDRRPEPTLTWARGRAAGTSGGCALRRSGVVEPAPSRRQRMSSVRSPSPSPTPGPGYAPRGGGARRRSPSARPRCATAHRRARRQAPGTRPRCMYERPLRLAAPRVAVDLVDRADLLAGAIDERSPSKVVRLGELRHGSSYRQWRAQGADRVWDDDRRATR
jgi:hypothetical protein